MHGRNYISKMMEKDVFRHSAERSDEVNNAGAIYSNDDLDV